MKYLALQNVPFKNKDSNQYEKKFGTLDIFSPLFQQVLQSLVYFMAFCTKMLMFLGNCKKVRGHSKTT